MASRHVGGVLALLRQGLTLGIEYGTHSLEALIGVAETVEEGVYEPRSLRRTPHGLAFALDNPLLRVGAFTQLAIRVDGAEVRGGQVRLRPGAGAPWRTADSVGPDRPWALAPGDRTEVEVDGAFGEGARPVTVRMELRTPAIPPLVWFEFTESPREDAVDP
ncbi:MAG: hypothetical protein ACRECT_04840 [Thermoplasmata archaeon]